MMTRKHYIAIAQAIAQAKTREEVARSLASYFATDNPRFNRKQFLAACNVTSTCPRCTKEIETQ